MVGLSSFLALAALAAPILAAPAPEPGYHHSHPNAHHNGNGGHNQGQPDSGSSDGEVKPPTSGSGAVGLPFAAMCSTDGVSIKGAPSELPPPSSHLSFVTIALGTQNYTCSSDGEYKAAGAVAELFDISCMVGKYGPDVLADQLMAFWEQAPKLFTPQGVIDFFLPVTSNIVLGQHYFVPNPKTGEGISPKWDFTAQGTHKGNADAFVTVERLASAPAPTGEDDIDWLATNAIDGKLSAQVYRTDTRGGKAPESCDTPGDTLEVKYVSNYWFFGSTLFAGQNHGSKVTTHHSNHVTSNGRKKKQSNNKNGEHHGSWHYTN